LVAEFGEFGGAWGVGAVPVGPSLAGAGVAAGCVADAVAESVRVQGGVFEPGPAQEGGDGGVERVGVPGAFEDVERTGVVGEESGEGDGLGVGDSFSGEGVPEAGALGVADAAGACGPDAFF